MSDETIFLFHVTYYGRLETIEEDGLVPGRARAIGGKAYDAHARSRVFLTEGPGIPFWFRRAIDHANHASDAVLDDVLVPVVLRVDIRKLDASRIQPDDVGTDDAKEDAFFYPEAIPLDAIEVWNGEQWDPFESEFPVPAVGVVVEDRQEDGTVYQVQTLKGIGSKFRPESPFFPPPGEWYAEYEEESADNAIAEGDKE